MIPGLFGKFRKRNKQKKKQKKRNRTLAEKKAEWISRWGSEDYDPFWDLKALPGSIRELIDSGFLEPGKTIVDIGCGSGFLSARLADEGYHVTGFDFAHTAIERARKAHREIPGKLAFLTADATKPLPLEGAFRFGIDRGTFHTLPKKNRADYVSSISPVIEEGGYLIMMYALRIANKLVESSADDPAELLKVHLAQLFSGHFEMEDFRPIMMSDSEEKDTPGFLIIFKKPESEH
jgi:SAM-dependent methyltransferase